MSHLLDTRARRAVGLWPAVLCALLVTSNALSAQSTVLATQRQLLQSAQRADASLQASRAMLSAARASAAATGGAPVTTLEAELADGLGGNIATGNLNITASRPLFSGARRNAARDVMAVDVAAAEREVVAHERALSLEITRDLAAAVGATRILQRIDAGDAWLADAESALTARFANGAARYLDVLRVRTERLQLAADRADAVADRRAAIAALAQRIAPDVTSGALAAMVDAAAREHSADDWLTLIGNRPPVDSLLGWSDALRAARADQARAAAQQQLVAAEQRTQWNGVAGVQRIGPDNGGPSMGIVLGVSSTLPFTARRGLLATRAAADSLAFAADANALAANAQTTATLQAAIAHDDAAQERVRILHGALGGATAGERDAALAHYRNGEISLLELLDFERALLRVEVERARAISAAAAARAALFGLDQ